MAGAWRHTRAEVVGPTGNTMLGRSSMEAGIIPTRMEWGCEGANHESRSPVWSPLKLSMVSWATGHGLDARGWAGAGAHLPWSPGPFFRLVGGHQPHHIRLLRRRQRRAISFEARIPEVVLQAPGPGRGHSRGHAGHASVPAQDREAGPFACCSASLSSCGNSRLVGAWPSSPACSCRCWSAWPSAGPCWRVEAFAALADHTETTGARSRLGRRRNEGTIGE